MTSAEQIIASFLGDFEPVSATRHPEYKQWTIESVMMPGSDHSRGNFGKKTLIL
jgi:hypothetical protein